MGTSGAVELEVERRGTVGAVGISSTSQLGTHWLIWGKKKNTQSHSHSHCDVQFVV